MPLVGYVAVAAARAVDCLRPREKQYSCAAGCARNNWYFQSSCGLAGGQCRYHTRMKTPQAGIFALGTASHAYLEFDVLEERNAEELGAAISALREPRTTIGGVNLVVGFRPELWNKVAPHDAPAGLQGFNAELVAEGGGSGAKSAERAHSGVQN